MAETKDSNGNGNGGSSLKIKIPGGGTFHVGGDKLVIFISILITIGWVWFSLKTQHESLAEDVKSLSEQFEISNFLLSREVGDRPKLRMPVSVLKYLPQDQYYEYLNDLRQERNRDAKSQK